MTDFVPGCSYFTDNFDSLWNNLKLKIAGSNPSDGVYICDFIANYLNTTCFFCYQLAFPLDIETKTLIVRFICSVFGKIHMVCQQMSQSNLILNLTPENRL